MKIYAVHAECPKLSVGHVFDFDGIRVYILEDTKNYEKLKKVAYSCADVTSICANRKAKIINVMNEISS